MSDSNKTTEVDNKVILEAILDLTKKVDGIKQQVDVIKQQVDGIESEVKGLKNQVGGLENRFNNFEKFANAQFEAIRQGISANSAAYDRLEATFLDNRSEFLHFRADMKDMHEEIRRWKNESTKETMELS